jgi:hypothetical protein
MLGVCLALLLAADPAAPAAYPPYPTQPQAYPPNPSQPQAYPAHPEGPPPSTRPAAFLFSMGFDRGGEDIAEVGFTDGSTQMLRANEGFYLAGGLALFRVPMTTVALDTAITIAVKGWEAGAENGKISYLAFPLEVVERLAYRQVRFGAGLSYSLAPKVSSSGDLSDFGEIQMDNSLGFVAQVEWIGPRTSQSGFFFGLRTVFQKLEPSDGFGAIGANAVGLYLGGEL